MNGRKILLTTALVLTLCLLCGCADGTKGSAGGEDGAKGASAAGVFSSALSQEATEKETIKGMLSEAKKPAEGGETSGSGGNGQTTGSSNGGKQAIDDGGSAYGLPRLKDVRTADDGDMFVLVNKLHGVSADYYPTDMVPVDGSLSTNQNLYFKREAYDAYLQMLADAEKEGLTFKICSTYRSYKTQKSLYFGYLSGKGVDYANSISAYPGRSEHHTGWAMDITYEAVGYTLSEDFANHPEGQWIDAHCSEYGFILRYPKGKTNITGYAYEPWHLRYVGVEAAKEITARGITLEEYLGRL